MTIVRRDPIKDYRRIILPTLRRHTEAAGDRLEPEVQRRNLTKSLAISQVCEVRRADLPIGDAMLRPDDGDRWFVTAFNIDPDHRNPGVFAASILSSPTIAWIRRRNIRFGEET